MAATNKASNEGYDAGFDGIARDANPYAPYEGNAQAHDAMHDAWDDGWVDGVDDARDAEDTARADYAESVRLYGEDAA